MAARTNLTVNAKAAQRLDPGAGTAKAVFVAGDVANGNAMACTGNDVLFVWNTHGSIAGTITIAGKADAYGRTGSITTYSVPFGEVHRFGPFAPEVFQQDADGLIYINVSAATMVLYAERNA